MVISKPRGRPRKQIPVESQPVSEAEQWEKDVESEDVKKPEMTKKGVRVVDEVAEAQAKSTRLRDAIFECKNGHETIGIEGQNPHCRLCSGPTEMTIIYQEPQRKVTELSVGKVGTLVKPEGK